MIYKLAICDDNEIDIQYISSFVLAWATSTDIEVRMDTFTSAEAFLFQYTDDKSYDILLLDIEMGEMNGIELAKKIRDYDSVLQIVFITGYFDFIAEGYEVSALHYLLKPVYIEKLSSVLDKAVKNLGKLEKNVLFNVNGEAIKVPIDKIAFVEAFAHSCTIMTVTNAYEVKLSITDLEGMLGDEFVRCHRSYIVGLRHIKSITKANITLDQGKIIPLSRRKYYEVNQAFIRYYGNIRN